MARRGAPGRNPVPQRKAAPSAATSGANTAASLPKREAPAPALDGRAALQAPVAFAFGALAMVALPIAYGWAFRPAIRPVGADMLIPILELAGVVAAAVALLLGRRARAVGDRSGAAIWAPRLGGAAIVGYALTIVMIMFATR